MKDIPIDQIIRSSRRTISLEITPQARLIVRVPHRTPDGYIKKVVHSKSRWIITRQRIALEKKDASPPKTFSQGEMFLYLGRTYPLVFIDQSGPRLIFDGEFKLMRVYRSSAKSIFTEWYRHEAMRILTERCDYLANSHGFQYQKIKISDGRTRWGSCTGKGNLSFSWRLIMAPLEVIDYVIIHELSHLHEMNHSRRFWQKVKTLCPDYQRHSQWLKDNKNELEF